ncbi:ribonuclease P protein component [Balneatrix alpica]|uniref:Ribonuclease P protein component n=1 Tax=Balneatrix alpica TaxID=75684 RepID=A0ABV5Z9Z3_9GAMM|nr:ribonuclease P protein component [Balneatrix alpica]
MSTYSFPRTARLLTPGDYRQVFNGTCFKASDQGLLVLAIANGGDRSRLGLVIAKKHVRRANQRNRVKRLIRESFRHHQHELAALDLVVIARPGLGDIENPQLHTMLGKIWQRIQKKASAPVSSPAPKGRRQPSSNSR